MSTAMDIVARKTTDVSVDNPMTLWEWGCMRQNEYDAARDTGQSSSGKRPTENTRRLAEGWGFHATFDQLVPVRNKMPSIWRLPDRNDSVTVVGTHSSKSILLPVYRVNVPNVGVFTMRDNFHDWCISCDLQLPLPLDTYGELYRINEVRGYFEGFERGGAEVYGPLSENQRQFSIVLPSGFPDLYLFMHWTKRALDTVKAILYPH